ncbi:MAG TPA: threonine/serine exporter family protein [Rectinemataceae bacterium]|nr:threonine/serine exporter family protein [Rectinemataceae bacterium]
MRIPVGGRGQSRPPEAEDFLLLAADAARLVLESGGETYRAEETAQSIATGLGAVDVECFATPTGIVLSFSGPDGRVRSIVRRVSTRSLNLDRITRTEELVREVVAGTLEWDEAAATLGDIESSPEVPLLPSLAAAAAGTGFFTLFFGGAWNDALVAAFSGLILSRMTHYLARRRISDFFTNLAGGALIAAVALSAKGMGLAANADLAILGAAMYLVPGVAITNAIRDTIAGDLVAGVARAADAFMSAAAIAIGAGSALGVWGLFGGRI